MPDETTGLDRPKMRAGMPLAERQQLRAWLLEQALEQARRQAAEVHLSVRCRSHLPQRSPTLSYDQQRHEHTLCQGESAGNGCLCPWHDAEIEPVPDQPSDS
jgi:type II secretory pathway pseudopilin PulG